MTFNGRANRARAPAGFIPSPFSLSLLALAMTVVMHPAHADENTDEQEMIVYGDGNGNADSQQDYAVKTTRSGTKMLLTIRRQLPRPPRDNYSGLFVI